MVAYETHKPHSSPQGHQPLFMAMCRQGVVLYAISSFFGAVDVTCPCLDPTQGYRFNGLTYGRLTWLPGSGRGKRARRSRPKINRRALGLIQNRDRLRRL